VDIRGHGGAVVCDCHWIGALADCLGGAGESGLGTEKRVKNNTEFFPKLLKIDNFGKNSFLF
jgi:hypothetical protein